MNKTRKLRVVLLFINLLFIAVMTSIGVTAWQLLCNPGKSCVDEICSLFGLAGLSYIGGTLHGYTVRRMDAEKERQNT